MRFEINNGVLKKCNVSSFLTKAVTIPEEVTVIGKWAFADDCYHLKRIYLPPKLTAIEDEAFLHCFRLQTLAPPAQKRYKGALLPEGLIRIGDGAFHGCYVLKSVTLPSSVQTVGNEAFRGCHALTSLTIPETVQQVGERLLHDCWSVKRKLDGWTVRYAFEDILLHMFRPDGETFSFLLPRVQNTFSIEDGVTELLILKRFDAKTDPSIRKKLLCQMLEIGYLTEADIITHAEAFFEAVVRDDNTDAMRLLLDSGTNFPGVPTEVLDRMLLEANRQQKFDMQMLLMEAMKRIPSDKADILNRFVL